ncbi:MAG TPA: class I SAM-dependent methyltransferase, partial [Kofleriaceae bacterium]|nr:class I SAM-dependent methyltransferase [Kofleriaceae bacterium]
MTADRDAAFYDQRWTSAEVSNAKKLRGKMIGEVIEREARGRLRILELGCGTGWLCNELSRYGDCLGVDISSQAIDQARERYPRARFECVDLASWQPTGEYDAVISHEVIEHLRDQPAHVKIAHDALVPGGLFVLTTPNAFAATSAVAEIRHGYELQPIENWLYLDETRALLEAGGFAIDALTTISPWRPYRS